MKYRIYPAVDGKTELDVDTSLILGKGAQANIYRCYLDGKVYAAKLFHRSALISAKKIEQMIANPPDRTVGITAGREYPRYSWPIAIIQSAQGQTVGFLMPLIDLKESFTLDFYYDKTLIKSLGSADEVALSYKIEIAANLSSLISDLHSHGHYFIDFKPQNIRVFKRTHAVTLIDCDGFSINGVDGNRYPADLYSADYICPEAITHSTPASKLGLEQDRYALAVIIFQLLNNGIHPYQGILNSAAENAPTNDDKAAKGLYPHGLISDSRIAPRKQSVHHLIDDETRKLFDRAFTMPPELRPAASEWAAHLNSLLIRKALSVCELYPYDIRHMRFTQKACPECYLSSLEKGKELSTSLPSFSNRSDRASFGSLSAQPNLAIEKSTFWSDWGIYIALAIIFLIGLVAYSDGNKTQKINAAPPAPPPSSSSKPTPPTPSLSPPSLPPQPATSSKTVQKYDGIVSPSNKIHLSQISNAERGVYATRLSEIETMSPTELGVAISGQRVIKQSSKIAGVAWNIIENRQSEYYKLAIDLTNICYKMGHPECASNMGYIYEYGLGVPMNFHNAKAWYQKAIKMGGHHSAQAELQIAEMYASGKLGADNVAKARKYFNDAISTANSGGWLQSRDSYLSRANSGLQSLDASLRARAPHGYASVYWDPTSEVFSWALGYQSQGSADASAKASCAKRGARAPCEKAVGAAARCLAIYYGQKYRYVEFGDSLSEAESRGLTACKNNEPNSYTCTIPTQGSGCSSW